MNRIFQMGILLLLSVEASGQQPSKEKALKDCHAAYKRHLDGFKEPDLLEPTEYQRNYDGFRKLFAHPGVKIYNPLQQQNAMVGIETYVNALGALSDHATMQFKHILYCRDVANPKLYYIHFEQSFRGRYTANAQPLPVVWLTMTVVEQADEFKIASIRKADATAAADADDDGDGVANRCDKCRSIAGGLEHWGADPYTPCSDDPKKPKAVQDFEPKMVLVEGGTCYLTEWSSIVDSAYLDSYFIGKYEITVKQFEAFINDSHYKTDAEKNGNSFIYDISVHQGNCCEKSLRATPNIMWRHNALGKLRSSNEYQHPISHVSWNDAKAYCEWLSQKTGKRYRLPKQIEWEFAAHGGNKSKRYIFSGSNDLKEVAWTDSDKNKLMTYSVGKKKANELGIYDMTGNVEEWCEEHYLSDDNSQRRYCRGAGFLKAGYVSGYGTWNIGTKFVPLQTFSSSETGFRVVYSLK